MEIQIPKGEIFKVFKVSIKQNRFYTRMNIKCKRCKKSVHKKHLCNDFNMILTPEHLYEKRQNFNKCSRTKAESPRFELDRDNK